MDTQRLIQIVALLYLKKQPEVVISIEYAEPDYHYEVVRVDITLDYSEHGDISGLAGRKHFVLTDEECDWLVADRIVEFDSGSESRESCFVHEVFIMTDTARVRLKKILREIIAKRVKLPKGTT